MSRYLPYQEFKKLYPFSFKGKEKVYIGSDYVVKRGDLFSDIAYPCMFKHPNIINTLAYTCLSSKEASKEEKKECSEFMAIPKGESILEAYKSGKISLKQIAYDIAAALNVLHDNKICHNDVKEDNIILLDSKAVLIDFGISSRAIYYDKGYGHSRLSQSNLYRPPDSGQGYFNPIEDDLYALGRTLISLYFKGDIEKIANYLFSCPPIEDTEIKEIVDKCLNRERLETNIKYEVKKVKKRVSNRIEKEVMEYVIIDICYRFDFYVHEMALSLELIYRLDKIDKDYAEACTCMVVEYPHKKRLEAFSMIGENIVMPTWYDYVQFEEEIPHYLYYTFRNRRYISTITEGTPKREGKLKEYEILKYPSFSSASLSEEKEEKKKVYPSIFKESAELDDNSLDSIIPYLYRSGQIKEEYKKKDKYGVIEQLLKSKDK